MPEVCIQATESLETWAKGGGIFGWITRPADKYMEPVWLTTYQPTRLVDHLSSVGLAKSTWKLTKDRRPDSSMVCSFSDFRIRATLHKREESRES